MRSLLLAAFAFGALVVLPATAAAGPPKPGKKCEVASAGVAADGSGGTPAWTVSAAALLAVVALRRTNKRGR